MTEEKSITLLLTFLDGSVYSLPCTEEQKEAFLNSCYFSSDTFVTMDDMMHFNIAHIAHIEVVNKKTLQKEAVEENLAAKQPYVGSN